jgi:transposase-like protein
MEPTEINQMQALALKQLLNGQSLTGKDGVFAPLLKKFLEAALEAEMSGHLDESQRSKGNKRNGKKSKTVKTLGGEFEILTPQDRHSSFEPQLIRKRETILAENLAPQIIALYGLGNSFRDISNHIKKMYDVDVSHSTLSEITDRVIPLVKEWQNRALDELYPIVWMDAMHFKIKHEGRVVSRAVYNILAINTKGYKEVIGIYVSESEGAKFWLNVLTDLKSRGVKDILISCIDNLTGFAEAINSVFPHSEVQLCVLHQVRNSLGYITHKDKPEFIKGLKNIYRAVNKSQAEIELDNLEEKWGKKYPIVIKSWRTNWENLSTYFQYDTHIRRTIYTTNPVEGYHRQIRKVAKAKGPFPNDMALLKLLYLATENISEKWTQPVHNWALTAQQLSIRFSERMRIDI